MMMGSERPSHSRVFLPSMTQQIHHFHRHPLAPWMELRVSGPSPHCFRLHAHDEYSIGIVDHGSAVFHHAGGPERVNKGSIVLIEPGRWHACNPDQVTDWAYRMLFVRAEWVHEQLQATSATFPQRALHDAKLAATVDRLCLPLDGQHAGVASHVRLLRDFLQRVSSLSVADGERNTSSFHAVHEALETLHRHPGAATSVQSLAHATGMSASRFIRHFKAATGVTPGAYRLNLRLNGARRLLAQGMHLADAAHCMGFADQAHMQRAFKAHHSLTPGNYASTAETPKARTG